MGRYQGRCSHGKSLEGDCSSGFHLYAICRSGRSSSGSNILMQMYKSLTKEEKEYHAKCSYAIEEGYDYSLATLSVGLGWANLLWEVFQAVDHYNRENTL